MIKASELLQVGKEAQDVIQAWVDPEMTKGRMAEAEDLAPTLWNLAGDYPEIKTHMWQFFSFVSAGGGLESLREYATGDWVEWDLPIFNEV